LHVLQPLRVVLNVLHVLPGDRAQPVNLDLNDYWLHCASLSGYGGGSRPTVTRNEPREEPRPAVVVDGSQIARQLGMGETNPRAALRGLKFDRHQRRAWWQLPRRIDPSPRERDEDRSCDLDIRPRQNWPGTISKQNSPPLIASSETESPSQRTSREASVKNSNTSSTGRETMTSCTTWPSASIIETNGSRARAMRA